MYTPSLRDFIKSVPVCAETASPEVVLELLKEAVSDCAVILNDQQHPIGIISLHKLLPYCVEDNRLAEMHCGAPISLAVASGLGDRSEDASFLEPLATLPAYWTVNQFQPYLHAIEHHQWAVVDASGQFLGLLDRLRLLRFFAVHAVPGSVTVSPPAPLNATQSLDPLDNSIESASPAINLDPLVVLLERLPLPMMLQTSAGRVIAQNGAWRQQVGELQDPVRIWQEAAYILEAIASSPLQAGADESFGAQSAWQPFQASPSVAYESSSPTNTCRIGPNANTCVCTCPMKNGQERIWQLIKIPLGTVLSQLHPVAPALSLMDEPEALSSVARFQLANLELMSYPPWTAVTQTESLWLVMAQDTTEQQQVAKELAAKNADLVQLNRLKDEFLACISHELKTPLTAILGLSGLLKDQALGVLNDRQKRYADLIHQSGRHLVAIVNDILDLTRIETGQLELTLEPVQIETVCQRAHDQARQVCSLGAQIQEKDEDAKSFRLEIQPELGTLIADEMRLRQMLVNLLSNAIKFTAPGGSISLTVDSWDGWIAFTVSDTGIGIPVDKQHLIFQKFQQLENPLIRRYEGTGLGLVLTQRLARLHGGDVTFTSVEDEGSQFTLLLPPCPPPATASTIRFHQVKAPRLAAMSNRLAIIVEAVPRFWEDLAHQLTGLGYRVAIARSGTEAIEKIRRLQPGVVFLNPLLPLLSGWDVLTLLKADPVSNHIPIVVTATRVEKTHATRNGADGFLSLPIQSEALRHCLDQIHQSVAASQVDTAIDLTILHLRDSGSSANGTDSGYITDLNSLLIPYQCRVLEVDDLDQADLLARVWKPNVVLLEGNVQQPERYLEELNQYPYLASLPLVTLTPEIAELANQIPGLSVFPYLGEVSAAVPGAPSCPVDAGALLQVLQTAAGMNWTPHVLIVEPSQVQPHQGDLPAIAPSNVSSSQANKTLDWLQACAQYIQMAGFRSSTSYAWDEVLEQLQYQSVDLLLICINSSHPYSFDPSVLQALEHLQNPPKIFIWNYHAATDSLAVKPVWQEQLGAIATRMFPASMPLAALVNEISRFLS